MIHDDDINQKFVRVKDNSDMIADTLNSRIQLEKEEGNWYVLDYEIFVDTASLKYSNCETFYVVILFERELETQENLA